MDIYSKRPLHCYDTIWADPEMTKKLQCFVVFLLECRHIDVKICKHWLCILKYINSSLIFFKVIFFAVAVTLFNLIYMIPTQYTKLKILIVNIK